MKLLINNGVLLCTIFQGMNNSVSVLVRYLDKHFNSLNLSVCVYVCVYVSVSPFLYLSLCHCLFGVFFSLLSSLLLTIISVLFFEKILYLYTTGKCFFERKAVYSPYFAIFLSFKVINKNVF